MSAVGESLRRLTGGGLSDHGASIVVGLGHGATHWISAVLYVLMPFIGADLGLSYTEIGGIVSLLYLASFTTNLASGPLVDLTGRYVLLQAASLLIGGLALISVAFASGAGILVASVIAMGMSISLWHPPALTFLTRRYPAARGLALSLHNLGASLGDTLAPVAAGALLTILAWPQTALVASLPLFVMMATILIFLKEPVAAGTAAGGRPRRAGYVAGVKLLLRNTAILKLVLMSGLRSMTQNGIMVFLPLYLVGALSASPALVGLSMMTLQIGGTVAGPVAGMWSDRIGRRPLALAGLGTTCVLLPLIVLAGGSAALLPIIALTGIAIFSVRPVVHGWTMDLARDETAGSSVSLLFLVQNALTALVPLAGGFIADTYGLAAVFYVLTATCALATLVAALMANSRPSGPQA